MKKTSTGGFTLIEIMMVVAIIGLLASLGIPAMLHASNNARAKRFAHDIEAVHDVFVQYYLDTGSYPPEAGPAQIPAGMTNYLAHFPWTEDTVIGGLWDYQQFGTYAGVSVFMPAWNDDQMTAIDKVLDDGNLSTGHFFKLSQGYIYVLEM